MLTPYKERSVVPSAWPSLNLITTKVKNVLSGITTVLEQWLLYGVPMGLCLHSKAKLSIDTLVRYIKQHKALEVNIFSFLKSTSTPSILYHLGPIFCYSPTVYTRIFWIMLLVRCARCKSLEKLIIFREKAYNVRAFHHTGEKMNEILTKHMCVEGVASCMY